MTESKKVLKTNKYATNNDGVCLTDKGINGKSFHDPKLEQFEQ